MLTKDPLPMDIDFLVQDTYSLVRPNWKLVTDLSEAAKLFAEAVNANYKQPGTGKSIEQPDEVDDSGSEELGEGDLEIEPEMRQSSDEEGEVSNTLFRSKFPPGLSIDRI